MLCNENTILSTELNMICRIEYNILYAGSAVNNFKELKKRKYMCHAMKYLANNTDKGIESLQQTLIF